jgi:hypothetical protein
VALKGATLYYMNVIIPFLTSYGIKGNSEGNKGN